MSDSPNRIEALLEEGDFLARLTRALVRDENRAEDFVQETWLAALKRPPRGEIRPWFTAVLRNLVRQNERTQSRRESRERSAARSEVGPSPEEIQQRESTRRLVVEKVLALPQPYRTAVLLRYFEGWEPRRIARETNCPVETVKTRLKRALERLRIELDGESGGREAWAVALVHAARMKVAGAPLAEGAILLSTTTKVVIGVALLATLVATVPILTSRNHDAGLANAGAEPIAVSSAPPAATPEIRSTTREKPTEPSRVVAPVAPVPRDAIGVLAFGTVTDAHGVLLADANVTFEDGSGKPQRCRTLAETGYSIVGLHPGHWTVSCRAENYLPSELAIDLEPAPGGQRLDFKLESSPQIRIHVVTPDGAPIAKVIPRDTFRMTDAESLCVIATRNPVGSRLPSDGDLFQGGFGVGGFTLAREWSKRSTGPEVQLPPDVLGVLTLSAPPPVFVSVVLGDVVLDTKSLPAGVEDVTLVVSTEAFAATLGSLRGQFVFADTGEPVVGAPICLQSNNRGEGSSVAVKTDASGLAVWEHELPGLYDLQAFVEGYEGLFLPARVEPGGKLDLGIVKLYRRVSVQGIVVDEQGQPRSTNFVGYNLTRGQTPETFPIYLTLPGSNEQGILKMSVDPGRWFLIPRGDENSRWAQVGTLVDTSAGSVENIRIVLHPAVQVSLRPESDSEHPTLVTIEDAAGLCLLSKFFRSSDAETVLLARGTYTMNTVASDQPKVSRSFTVGVEPMSIPVPR